MYLNIIIIIIKYNENKLFYNKFGKMQREKR